ncbi:MAG: tetratricopeptide repeat protein [bacterium]|nr:tetratricopeptide repeat protein [bacterium]
MPVPRPQLNSLEKVIGRQLLERRKMADAVIADSSVSKEKRARAYGDLGQLYHAYDLTAAASACYHNAVVLDPACFEWNYAYGYLLQSLGSFSKALELFKKVKPGEPEPSRAYLIDIRIGQCYRSLNQPGEAKKAFESAYRLNPRGPSVLARLGEIALEEKHYEEAITYLVSALERQPEANQLHYPLAMAYRGAGKMEQARYHLSKRGMVGVQPPDPLKKHLNQLVTGYRVHLLAGRRAFSAKRYIEAEALFRKAIEVDPGEVGAKVNLSAVLVQLKKYREAMIRLQEVVKSEPGNVTARFNLGTLSAFLGDFKEAVIHLQVVVEKNPTDAVAHLNLADAFRKNRRAGKAVGHYKAAVKLDPGLTSGWLYLNLLLTSGNRHAEALEVLEEAHSLVPHNTSITHALARQLAASPILSKRQGQRALELALNVFQVTPHFSYARTIAMAYAQLNQCEKAISWMERAITIASGSSQPASVLEKLKMNLDYFKTNRPCRIPANQ